MHCAQTLITSLTASACFRAQMGSAKSGDSPLAACAKPSQQRRRPQRQQQRQRARLTSLHRLLAQRQQPSRPVQKAWRIVSSALRSLTISVCSASTQRFCSRAGASTNAQMGIARLAPSPWGGSASLLPQPLQQRQPCQRQQRPSPFALKGLRPAFCAQHKTHMRACCAQVLNTFLMASA